LRTIKTLYIVPTGARLGLMRKGILLVIAGVTLPSSAEDITFTNKVASFTNLQGTVFKNVVLVRADKDGLIWRDGVSGGRVFYTNLHPDLLESFGVPTNGMELARSRTRARASKASDSADMPIAVPRPIRSDPELIDDYFRLHSTRVSVRLIADYDLPKKDQQKRGCRAIVSELKQMRKMLELGLTYSSFCDLVQQKAISIEKLKDEYRDLGHTFLSAVDRCLKQWADSRKQWSDKMQTDSDSQKERAEARLQECWAEAEAEFLVCEGIAEGNIDPNPIYEQEATIIMLEQKSPTAAGGYDYWFPEIMKMTKGELVTKLKSTSDKRRPSSPHLP
jgi:hypothetical protein